MISYFFTLGLSPCTAWVGHKYIGEVISPFRTVPRQKMTAQFLFFQSLPPKQANFVKKKPIELGVLCVFSSSSSSTAKISFYKMNFNQLDFSQCVNNVTILYPPIMGGYNMDIMSYLSQPTVNTVNIGLVRSQ